MEKFLNTLEDIFAEKSWVNCHSGHYKRAATSFNILSTGIKRLTWTEWSVLFALFLLMPWFFVVHQWQIRLACVMVQVKEKDTLWFIKFFAPWCGHWYVTLSTSVPTVWSLSTYTLTCWEFGRLSPFIRNVDRREESYWSSSLLTSLFLSAVLDPTWAPKSSNSWGLKDFFAYVQ